MLIKIGGPLPRWVILTFLASSGVVLIVWPHWPARLEPSNPVSLISEGIGIAVLSSAILAFTIENWLRADLTKDMFLTAIAHHLPSVYAGALRLELSRSRDSSLSANDIS